MEDDAAFQLRPGERVLVGVKISEVYNGTGAVLVEVTERNCTQRFWLPVAALMQLPS